MAVTRARRSAEESRAAILDAAEREFAEYGISGGRVDRIALQAKASKERLYSYFGDKNGLLTEILEVMCDRMSAAIVLDGDDLPGYASELTEYFLSHPSDLRLCTWARLEPASAAGSVALVPRTAINRRIAEIVRAQNAGTVTDCVDAATLLQMITSIATFWADETYQPQPKSARARARCREQAAQAVARLVAPAPGDLPRTAKSSR